MKKTYIKPQAQSVALFTEEALLSLSGGDNLTVDTDKTTESQFSSSRGWSSDNWSATDED